METKWQQEFPQGKVAHCNRCGKSSELPRTMVGNRENSRAWRLIEMVALDCGHVDCHWVYEPAARR
jgi:hypothetical protein